MTGSEVDQNKEATEHQQAGHATPELRASVGTTTTEPDQTTETPAEPKRRFNYRLWARRAAYVALIPLILWTFAALLQWQAPGFNYPGRAVMLPWVAGYPDADQAPATAHYYPVTSPDLWQYNPPVPQSSLWHRTGRSLSAVTGNSNDFPQTVETNLAAALELDPPAGSSAKPELALQAFDPAFSVARLPPEIDQQPAGSSLADHLASLNRPTKPPAERRAAVIPVRDYQAAQEYLQARLPANYRTDRALTVPQGNRQPMAWVDDQAQATVTLLPAGPDPKQQPALLVQTRGGNPDRTRDLMIQAISDQRSALHQVAPADTSPVLLERSDGAADQPPTHHINPTSPHLSEAVALAYAPAGASDPANPASDNAPVNPYATRSIIPGVKPLAERDTMSTEERARYIEDLMSKTQGRFDDYALQAESITGVTTPRIGLQMLPGLDPFGVNPIPGSGDDPGLVSSLASYAIEFILPW